MKLQPINQRFSSTNNSSPRSLQGPGKCVHVLFFLLFLFSSLSLGAQTYCTPSVDNGLRYINRVQIGTIDNSSSGTGFTSGGYTDYTALSTDLEIGETNVLLDIEVFSNVNYGVQVWIDWDRDGEFTQTGDNIICDFGMDVEGTNSRSYTFDVPSTVTTGSTRMRVRLIYNNSSCDSPCLDFNYGEVEDYTIDIKASEIELTPPVIGAVTQPACGDTTGSVVLTGLPTSVDWEITQYPDTIKYLGSGGSTTITGLASGTYTFVVDEQTCPGYGDGLTAEYYNTIDLSGSPVLTRIDTTVDFYWGGSSPASSVNNDNFSVHWSGQVMPCYSETYSFRTRSDDGIRLWVDGDPIISNWTNHGSTYDVGTIDLVAGKHYDIVLEFFENSGGAVAELAWYSASQALEIIPRSQLFSDTSAIDYEPSALSDAVVIDPPLVTVFSLSEGGAYCLNSDSVALSLSGSETDVTYQLYLDGSAVGNAIVGTGASLDFPYLSLEGTYTVVGTHATNGCSLTMDGSAVIIDASPAAPSIDSIIQPTCVNSTGSVVLTNLPPQWEIFQTPNDTSYFGDSDTLTISNLALGTYYFSVATTDFATGLLGEYYNSIDLSGTPVLTRLDETIDFDLGGYSPESSIVNADIFSVRWSGEVLALYDEEYTFRTRSDDGVRLWVDGSLIIDNWTDHAAAYNTGTIVLEAGKRYDIVLEYYERNGQSVMELEWSSASQTQEIVPKSSLFSEQTGHEGCFSYPSDEVLISAQHVTPIMPDSVSVDRGIVGVADTDSITLRAYGGLGWTLRWYADACGATEIGTGTSLTLASPAVTTTYYALWETTCGQSACRSVEVAVVSVLTDSVTSIGESEATFYGSILSGRNLLEYGFYYSPDNDTSNLKDGGSALSVTAYSGVAVDLDDEVFSSDITALSNRSAYYVRSYMKDTAGQYFYGEPVRFITEKRDFSLALDGDGDALVIDKTSTANEINDWGMADNTFSLDFWMKKNSATNAKQVLFFNEDASNGYSVYLQNGDLKLSTPAGDVLTAALKIEDETWHYVAVTYDGANAVIYVDDNASTTSTTLDQPTDNNCFIGAGYASGALVNEFEGHLDALRFWNVALSADQVYELAYDIIEEGSAANTVEGVGSAKVIPSLAWENLRVSLGFNVKSTMEGDKLVPVALDYTSQDQMHDYPFFHSDARLSADQVAFNVVALGNAKPSPYLPRVYWRVDNTDSAWLGSANWSGFAYPGEGVLSATYPDVTSSDLAADSVYCEYTIIDAANTVPIVSSTPPQVQVLVDREEATGTYRVDESASELCILQGIYPDLFMIRVDNEQGDIMIDAGSTEVH